MTCNHDELWDRAIHAESEAADLRARLLAANDRLAEAEARVRREVAEEMGAHDLESRDCELYDEPEQDCITAGPEVLAADGCLPCRVRSLAPTTREVPE